jgi:UDP-glucose 4-epimerase
MTILITGGAGFIGSHLADHYINNGQKVLIIDDFSTGHEDNIAHLRGNKDLEVVKDTILDESALEPLIKKADMVYHLAAAVGVYTIVDKPLQSLITNLQGTEKVLTLCNKHKKKVLIASTSEVYGKSQKFPFKEDEDTVMGATKISRWSYAYAKAIDEFLGLAYNREHKLPVVVVRFFNTVGPRQTGRYGMVIPNFVRQALTGEDITVFGDGQQSRCFTYVGDVVNEIVKLMNNKKAEGEIFNVGGSEEINMENLAKKVLQKTGSRSKLVYIPYDKAYPLGFEDMQRRVPDLSKLKALTGYIPTKGIDEILDIIIEHKKKKLGNLYKY